MILINILRLCKNVNRNFKKQSILNLNLRLNTIIDYDRILVLDQGEISEFGSAAQLKQNQGIFHRCVLLRKVIL